MQHEIPLPSLSRLKTHTPSDKVRTRTKKKKKMNATNTQKCLFLMDSLTEITRKSLGGRQRHIGVFDKETSPTPTHTDARLSR